MFSCIFLVIYLYKPGKKNRRDWNLKIKSKNHATEIDEFETVQRLNRY